MISHSSEIHKSGPADRDISLYRSRNVWERQDFDLDLGGCLALSPKGQPHSHPRLALGPICLHTAEEPGLKGPPPQTLFSLCLWLPPPG